MADGLPSVCDLSPDGELAKLAERAATWARQADCPPDFSAPLVELQMGVKVLRGLAKGDARVISILMTEVEAWRKRCEKEIDGEPGRVIYDYTDSVRAAAGRLAANCKACTAGAFGLAHMHLRLYSLQARMEAQVAEAEARAADAEAEKFKALGRAEAETEARKRAEEKRDEAEAKRREAKIAERKAKTRGKSIPLEVKKAIADFVEEEYGGDLRGVGYVKAYDDLCFSPHFTPKVSQYVKNPQSLRRMVEAARVDVKRKERKTRRQKK